MDNLQTVTDWLNEHQHHTLLIEKKEQQDTDRVRLQLENVELHKNQKSLDGYTDGSTLLLNGAGVVITEDQQEAPLPGQRFVLHMDDIQSTQISTDAIAFQTARAAYSLRLQ